MANIYEGTLELIGHTPLVEFKHIEKKFGLEARLLAKLEYLTRQDLLRTVLQKR